VNEIENISALNELHRFDVCVGDGSNDFVRTRYLRAVSVNPEIQIPKLQNVGLLGGVLERNKALRNRSPAVFRGSHKNSSGPSGQRALNQRNVVFTSIYP
jgi:hypothetical protein